MIICCTKKLLKEIGIKDYDLVVSISDKSILGEWYANVFYIEHKKCVIFTNAGTLFTFITFGVNKTQIKDMGRLFQDGLGRILLDEDFNGKLIQDLVNEGKDIQFSKTHNKSVVGVMVDHMKNTKFMVMDEGGFENYDFTKIIKLLNRTPLLTQKFTYSIEELGRVLGVDVDVSKSFINCTI